MSREEIQKLLGGYATNTLSEAERRALFEAALEDQELFDALAKDQALREVLQDPSARQQLIAALGPEREPFWTRGWRWLRQPAALAMAGGIAVLVIAGGLVLRQTTLQKRPEALMADVAMHPPAPAASTPAVPASSVARLKAPEAAKIALEPKPAAKPAAPPAVAARREMAHVNVAAGAPAVSESRNAAVTVLPASEPAAAPPPPPPPPAAAPAPPPPVTKATGALADQIEIKPEALEAAPRQVGAFAGGGKRSLKRAKTAPLAAFVAAKPVVEYTLLLKDAEGSYSPVPSGTVLRAGDSVRLQVEPGEDGYVSLFKRDAATGWNLVESRRVEKAQHCVLPSTGGLQSDAPAQLELMLVFSHGEHVDVDALASQAQTSSRITVEFH